MVKLLFAGPSLAEASVDCENLDRRGPAAQGDLARAVLAGATAIGLVDGLYETVAAVWHKEILFALSQGVTVLGGASMGAMRAAECAAFGMRPIGTIAARYLSGALDDDAAVAQLHAPAELGYAPLTLALVDVDETAARMRAAGHVREAEAVYAAARVLFFKERTLERLLATAFGPDLGRIAEMDALYRRHAASLKQRDALAVVAALRALPDARRHPPETWRFNATQAWRDWLAGAQPMEGETENPARPAFAQPRAFAGEGGG